MKRGSRADEAFTLLFMLLAIGAIICYFAVPDRAVFFTLGGIAVILRVIQYVLRYF